MKSFVITLLALLGAGGLSQPVLAMSQVPQTPQTCNAEPEESTPVTAPLHTEGTLIKDQQGRTVLLRGVNLSGDAKVPPFMPLTDAAMLDPLPGWGVNTLRLLFTWEAFENTPCNYSDQYLRYYEQIVRWAGERGLYVIVDFHQDAYSRYSIDGCGEGFPQWAVYSGITRHEPDNGAACEGWGTKMLFDLSHHDTWHHFHADTESARSRYIAMTQRVAARLASYPNVVGYELINEPWGSDDELAALYRDVGSAIRAEHPSAILFVPPHALMSSGMGSNNIAKPQFSNFVYSPHFYDAFVILFKSWLGTDPTSALNGFASKAQEWNVPLLLGEFGAPATTSNVGGYMDALYHWMNKGNHHGTQWNYTPTWTAERKDGWNMEDLAINDNQGLLRPNFRPRAYPQAVAGSAIAFSEDQTNFSLSWENNPQYGSSRIFIPADVFTSRNLTTQGDIHCTYQASALTCDGSNGPVSLTLQ